MKSFLKSRAAQLATAWILYILFVGPSTLNAKSDIWVLVGVVVGLSLVVVTTQDIVSYNQSEAKKP